MPQDDPATAILEPCPFCRGSAHYDKFSNSINCVEWGCGASMDGDTDGVDDVVKAWNRRAHTVKSSVLPVNSLHL